MFCVEFVVYLQIQLGEFLLLKYMNKIMDTFITPLSDPGAKAGSTNRNFPTPFFRGAL
jgi:hypothetical protein